MLQNCTFFLTTTCLTRSTHSLSSGTLPMITSGQTHIPYQTPMEDVMYDQYSASAARPQQWNQVPNINGPVQGGWAGEGMHNAFKIPVEVSSLLRLSTSMPLNIWTKVSGDVEPNSTYYDQVSQQTTRSTTTAHYGPQADQMTYVSPEKGMQLTHT